MAISLLCPGVRCRKRVTFLDSSAGQTFPCPHKCGTRIVVPTPYTIPAWYCPYSSPHAHTPPYPPVPSPSSGSWKRKVGPLIQGACIVLPLLKKWGAFD